MPGRGWRTHRLSRRDWLGGVLASAIMTVPSRSALAARCGPRISSIGQLVRMSPCALDRLYVHSDAGPIPHGKVNGRALVRPGSRLAPILSRASRLVWQGKIFRCNSSSAINKFFGVRAVEADVYYGPSWLDGRPAIILDYRQTSRIYADFRDEIRHVGPCLYLGIMHDRTTCPPEVKTYFALEILPA